MQASKTYKKMYLSILEIAQERLHEGISYNEMKELLVKRGYPFDNDCIELSVKQWFFDSFTHLGADDNLYTSISDLENHLDCNFILKGESCLKLISYQTSRNSWRNGIVAITISIIVATFTIWNNTIRNSEQSRNSKRQMDSSLNLIVKSLNSIENKLPFKNDHLNRPDSTKK